MQAENRLEITDQSTQTRQKSFPEITFAEFVKISES